MNEEKWLPVVGFEGLYEVSSHGRVKSLERYVRIRNGERIVRERILKNTFIKTGYFCVVLTKNNKRKGRTVHSLVCEAFIGERTIGYECCHRDGVKTNNNLDNLRYDSKSNNKQDMKLNGTWQNGEKVGTHKLTEKEVQEIYLLLKNTNTTYREISKIYKLHESTIYYINTGKSWHLDSISYPISKRSKLLPHSF